LYHDITFLSVMTDGLGRLWVRSPSIVRLSGVKLFLS